MAHLIRTLAQIDALTSPVRGEIVDVVDLQGPVSIAEIAAVLARPADSLYYHVRRLLKVGLLIEIGKRKATRRSEAVYDLPSRPMRVEYGLSQRSFIRILIKSIHGMLRLAGRDLESAFERGLVRDLDRERNTIHSRALGWFTDGEILVIRRQTQKLISKFRSSSRRRKENSRLYALTTILVPIAEKEQRFER